MKKTALYILIVLIFTSLTAVSGKDGGEFKLYKVGDRGPGGGIVFYDKGNSSDGWQYLEVSPVDVSSGAPWSNGEDVITNAADTALGTGRSNTSKIIKVQGNGKYAAKLCAEYNGGGKGDWYLPSKDELDTIFKRSIGVLSDGKYWTSSEFNNDKAWSKENSRLMREKFDSASWQKENKGIYKKIRAVRAFKAEDTVYNKDDQSRSLTGANENDRSRKYEPGETGPGGGKVFYDKGKYSDGWRYLEVTSSDLSSSIKWHNGEDKETGAVETAPGSGKSNTRKIIDILGDGKYAAKLCADYRGGGMSDWYLPSKDELDLLYKKGYIGIDDSTYWSSTEISVDKAWAKKFDDIIRTKFQQGSNSRDNKSSLKRVRAVRSF